MAKYVVSAITAPDGEPVGIPTFTGDPEAAVLKWFQLSEKYPTCSDIQAQTNEAGLELLKWANTNGDKIAVWAKDYNCPYKLDWLQDQIRTAVKNNKTSMQWEFDSVFPFSVG